MVDACWCFARRNSRTWCSVMGGRYQVREGKSACVACISRQVVWRSVAQWSTIRHYSVFASSTRFSFLSILAVSDAWSISCCSISVKLMHPARTVAKSKGSYGARLLILIECPSCFVCSNKDVSSYMQYLYIGTTYFIRANELQYTDCIIKYTVAKVRRPYKIRCKNKAHNAYLNKHLRRPATHVKSWSRMQSLLQLFASVSMSRHHVEVPCRGEERADGARKVCCVHPHTPMRPYWLLQYEAAGSSGRPLRSVLWQLDPTCARPRSSSFRIARITQQLLPGSGDAYTDCKCFSSPCVCCCGGCG